MTDGVPIPGPSFKVSINPSFAPLRPGNITTLEVSINATNANVFDAYYEVELLPSESFVPFPITDLDDTDCVEETTYEDYIKFTKKNSVRGFDLPPTSYDLENKSLLFINETTGERNYSDPELSTYNTTFTRESLANLDYRYRHPFSNSIEGISIDMPFGGMDFGQFSGISDRIKQIKINVSKDALPGIRTLAFHLTPYVDTSSIKLLPVHHFDRNTFFGSEFYFTCNPTISSDIIPSVTKSMTINVLSPPTGEEQFAAFWDVYGEFISFLLGGAVAGATAMLFSRLTKFSR
jgi:hypothetical protein